MTRGGERIEVFGIICNQNDIPVYLTYKYTITSNDLNKEAYGVLNSLIVIAPNKFYVTKFLPYVMSPYHKETLISKIKK